jgi:ribosomal protein L11 methyltransferase
MQNYILCEINCEQDLSNILMAELGELNFEGFIETDAGFEAYLPEEDFKKEELLLLLKSYHLPEGNILIKTVVQQNWNAAWESSFEPVCIGSELRIRAPFHTTDASFPIELLIQPKTSFGTGHHETTFTIMELMLNMDMKGKQVFDYGSGTGILAILASKLGSNRIFANDIDTWAAENIFENIGLNQAQGIEFVNGDLSIVPAQEFDIILANINKNILLASFNELRPLLKKGGAMFVSGFYETDLPDLMLEANSCGFKLMKQVTRNQWTAAELTC